MGKAGSAPPLALLLCLAWTSRCGGFLPSHSVSQSVSASAAQSPVRLVCCCPGVEGPDKQKRSTGTWTVVRKEDKQQGTGTGTVVRKGARPNTRVELPGRLTLCPSGANTSRDALAPPLFHWTSPSGARELTTRIKECGTVTELCLIVLKSSAAFNSIHTATAFHRLATLSKSPPRRPSRDVPAEAPVDLTEALEQLTSRAVLLIDEFQAQGVANTLWALATLRSHEKSLWALVVATPVVGMLERRVEAVAADMKPQETSNTLWALATMSACDGSVSGLVARESVVRVLERRVDQVAGELKAQETANVMWASAKLGRAVPASVMRRAEQVAGAFTPQGVANVLWALSCSAGGPGPTATKQKQKGGDGRTNVRLVQVLQLCAARVAAHAKPQEVATILRALAVLDRRPGPALLWALEARVDQTAGQFNAQDVANSLWAFGYMGVVPGGGWMRPCLSRPSKLPGVLRRVGAAQ